MAQPAWTLRAASGQGLARLLAFGPSRRVRAYLRGLLSVATQARYSNASADFLEHCRMGDIPFEQLDQETQDWVIADYVLLQHDEQESLSKSRALVAALQKDWSRRKFATE